MKPIVSITIRLALWGTIGYCLGGISWQLGMRHLLPPEYLLYYCASLGLASAILVGLLFKQVKLLIGLILVMVTAIVAAYLFLASGS